MCGSRQVRKLLSAPRLNLSHGSPSADEAAGARSERPARSGPMTAEIRELQGQLMRGLRKLIDATEDVGDRFAEEARRAAPASHDDYRVERAHLASAPRTWGH